MERIHEPMDKNRIRGVIAQGERAHDREAFVVNGRWCKSGGCVEKDHVLTWGDPA